MAASLDSCGIQYLFIYLSDFQVLDMIFNPGLLLNALLADFSLDAFMETIQA